MKFARKLIGGLTVLALAVSLFGPVVAQEGGSGIQVSPTRSELTINPGEAATVQISLRNTTSGEVTAKPLINDFFSDNETGQPKLIVDQSERSPYSVESFVSGLQDVELKAGESKDLQVFVQVPPGQPSGAYFSAIRFNAVPKANEQAAGEAPQVSLTASVAVLLLVEVPGNITEKIELQSVKAYLGNKAGNLFMNKPSHAGVTIKNLGNGYARPFGKVVVKNPLGREVKNYEINNTNPRGNILPDSSRNFQDSIDGAVTWPGRYTITANISHGRGGEILSVSSTFWYFPWWFLVVVGVLLLLLVFVAFRLYRHYISQPVTKRRH